MSTPPRGPSRGFPYNQQSPQNQQVIPGYAPASSSPYNQCDRRYSQSQPSAGQMHTPNYYAYPNVQFVQTYSATPAYGPLTPPRESPSPFPGHDAGYYGRQRAGSQSSGSEFMSETGRDDQQRLMQPPSEFSRHGGQGQYLAYGSEKDTPSPGSSKHTTKRRHGQGGDRQTKHWKGPRGREAEDTYILIPLPKEGKMPDYLPGAAPQVTLMADEYKDVFQQLNERVCRTTYDWLAQYKFRIPVSRSMKDHKLPEDRELTEYVQIVKKLIEGREVPNHAVRDERIKEVISIMEGAAEIRHVTIHVSRKQKPDRRVLGFIAAVAEYCWILGDERGAIEINNLYAMTEEKTRRRKEELDSHSVTDDSQKSLPIPA